MGLTPELKEEIEKLVRDNQSLDSIELGDAKGRIKVYVDFGRKDEAKTKIGNAIEILKDKKTEVLE